LAEDIKDEVLGEDLMKAARVAMKDVMDIKKDERVLIITNPSRDVSRISRSLYEAAVELEGRPVLMVQPVKTQLDMASSEVLAAIRSEPEILISISREKLGKDPVAIKDPIKVGDSSYDHYFNYLLGEKKSRSFWSPSVTEDMFIRTVPIDYKRLKEECAKVKEVLDRGEEVLITAPSGTNVTIGIRGREAKTDDGDFGSGGDGGNLPAGETFISPELGASHGRIVFDGSIASDKGIIIIEQPIECDVDKNLVTNICGGDEARQLRDTIARAKETTERFVNEGKISKKDLEHYHTNTNNLGELGIGLNHNATIIGNMLEDEKVYGTCHIAIGSNYDNDAKALIHLDGLIKAPTITVRGPGMEEIIMKEGELVI
jgi:leucyl aminopeptidase (aminopeptidase T)